MAHNKKVVSSMVPEKKNEEKSGAKLLLILCSILVGVGISMLWIIYTAKPEEFSPPFYRESIGIAYFSLISGIAGTIFFGRRFWRLRTQTR